MPLGPPGWVGPAPGELGPTRTEIRVVPAPGGGDLVSGSFSGSYAGEGGKGTIAGRFERCLYRGLGRSRP